MKCVLELGIGKQRRTMKYRGDDTVSLCRLFNFHGHNVPRGWNPKHIIAIFSFFF